MLMPACAASALANSVLPVPTGTVKKEVDALGSGVSGAGHHLCRQFARRAQMLEIFPSQGRCKRLADQRRDPFLARGIGAVHDLAQRPSQLEIAGLPCQATETQPSSLRQTRPLAMSGPSAVDPSTRLASIDAEQSRHGARRDQ